MNTFKSVWFGLMPIALAIIVSSCGNTPEEQVKKFAADFAAKVSKNQKDSLVAVWPDVAKADSLALTFNADSIGVEATQTTGQYKVTLGDADMLVTLAEDGKMTVGETHGLFAWPAERFDLAKNTGQWKEGLNDIEQAARMADTLFVPWMQAKIDATMKSLVKITTSNVSVKRTHDFNIMMVIDLCNYSVTVANETDHEVGGNDYTISVKETWVDWDDGFAVEKYTHPNSASKMLTGKPIPAKGMATYTWNRTFASSRHQGSSDYGIQSMLNYTPKQPGISYNFSGKEYDEYLSQKK